VALTAEILARPWTPLVVRELLLGSVRFNDIHRGVSRMSRTLLSTRLDELREAGILERRSVDGHPEYHLTEAGTELRAVIMGMGEWGTRWLRHELDGSRLDLTHLMWDVRRGVVEEALPAARTVVRFQFEDAPEERRRFWLVLERGAVDLCLDDPGYDVDLRVRTDAATLADVWLGDVELRRAVTEGDVEVRGPRELRRRFPDWLGLSPLAGVERPE
jgi:DNA-binding HxlR family transcriptional regulator